MRQGSKTGLSTPTTLTEELHFFLILRSYSNLSAAVVPTGSFPIHPRSTVSEEHFIHSSMFDEVSCPVLAFAQSMESTCESIPNILRVGEGGGDLRALWHRRLRFTWQLWFGSNATIAETR